MKKAPNIKGLMNYILIGSVVGLLIAILKYLFDWNAQLTNIILFSTVSLILLGFLSKFFYDYFKMKRLYTSYEKYLANYEMDKYIEAVQDALSKTKIKTYQDIHRISLSLGYGYIGEYQKAIDELAQTYSSSKNMSPSAILSIVNIINYYIQLDDFKSAKKIQQRAEKIITAYQNDPKYGILIEINNIQVALKEKNLDKAYASLQQAELYRDLIKAPNHELDIVKAKVLIASGKPEEARDILKPLEALVLPPVFKKSVNQLLDLLNKKHRLQEKT